MKAYPLEKIRLATADEMLSAEYIVGALKDVEQEISGGRLQVEDYIPPQGPEEDAEAEAEAMEDEEPRQELSAQADRKRELTHDVPQAMKPAETEPHLMPFEKKQRLFEQLAKDLGAPTALEEAACARQVGEGLWRAQTSGEKGGRKKRRSKGVRQPEAVMAELHHQRLLELQELLLPLPELQELLRREHHRGNGWEQ